MFPFPGETKTFRPRILSRRLPQPGRTESLWRRRWNKRDYLTAKRTKFLAMTFNFTVLRFVLDIEVKELRGHELYVTLPRGWGSMLDFQGLWMSAISVGCINTAKSIQKSRKQFESKRSPPNGTGCCLGYTSILIHFFIS